MTDFDERSDEDIQIVDQPADTAELVDVLTGELLGQPTVDNLIDLYERYDAAEKAARSARLQMAAALAARSPRTGGFRTTRVRGEHRRVKIEFPEDSWDQSRLKEAWFVYPQFREGVSRMRSSINDQDVRQLGCPRAKLNCLNLNPRGANGEPFGNDAETRNPGVACQV